MASDPTMKIEALEVLEIPADYGELIRVRVVRRADGSVVREPNGMPYVIQIAMCDPGESFEESYNGLDLPVAAFAQIGSWLQKWMEQDVAQMKAEGEPPEAA